MRIDVTPQFAAALNAPVIRPALFVELYFGNGPLHLWTGRGDVTWNAVTWSGVGALGSVSTIEEGANIQARGVTLMLAGIDPTLLSDALNDLQQGLPCTIYFGLFDDSFVLIPNPVIAWRGRIDQPTIELNGTSATISIACESRLLDMNNPAQRRYTNEDQQRQFPNDLGFSFVNAIQETLIYWGRVPSGQNNM